MSRNWMPGFGKSGIVRTSDARSRSGRGGRAIMSSQSPCPYGSMLLVGPDVPVRQIGQHREDQQEAEDRIADLDALDQRSEEHTSELQSLMRISYAVFCLKKKQINKLTIRDTFPLLQLTAILIINIQ